MIYIFLGKPLVFWIGIVALASFSYQMYLGMQLKKGRFDLLPRHRLNAFVLSFIVIVHLLLGLSLYL